MLDFSFTPAQEAFRHGLRELALGELLPRYQANEDEAHYPAEQIRRIVGYGESFWQEHEGGPDLISVGITAEEIARGDFNCVLPSLGRAYRDQFYTDITPEQEARWLSGVVSGEQVIALAITEPEAGSDMGQLATRAVREGASYVLDGVKSSVSFLNGDVFYTFARTDPRASGWQGISGFLVPRKTPGLSFEPYQDLGCRAIPRGIVRYEGVRVPVEARVGPAGTAFQRISRFFDVNRAVIALKCVGAALQTLDETLAHTRTRKTFGAPLASRQAVSFALAEIATRLDMARWQAYRVLWLRQQGIPCQREGAMIKWWAPKVATEAIHQCLLFHGHRGYTRELPIEQRLRDVIGWQIGDGSAEVMKLILTRELYAGAGAGEGRIR